jgi:phosphonate transport system substrate-binding protein
MKTSCISRHAAIAFFVAALACPLAARAADEPLVLAFIPQENPEKLIGDIAVIGRYLESEIGRKVKGYVTQDHAAAVEALAAGKADISFMGALPYVLAHHHAGAQVILSEVYRGKATYTSRIYVRKASPIRTLDALRGKTIAFADPLSESGYMYPLDLFVAAGLLRRKEDPQNFFRRVYFAGGYQQAMQALANGLVDAAGASVYATLLLPPAQQPEVVSIAESPEIPSHAVIGRKGIDPELRDKFAAAMMKLNEPDHRHLLKHVYAPDGYVRTRHEDYAAVEALARAYGLIE